MAFVAGIELGGTSVKVAVCDTAVCDEAGALRGACVVASERVPTTTPAETLDRVCAWLRTQRGERRFDAVGIACFGPVDLCHSSDTYGFITTTPKPNWKNADVVGGVRRRLEADGGDAVRIAFDTDVNAPALLHARAHGVRSCAYVTVGTGVGVGFVVEGQCVHGVIHPEMGHTMVRARDGDTFAGTCPFHGACVEGNVASGALVARSGVASAAELPRLDDTHALWDDVAYYLGQLCATIAYTVSSELIVLGGGVMQRASLFAKVRTHFLAALNGYLNAEQFKAGGVDKYIVPSTEYGDAAGLIGAAQLAVALLHNGAGAGAGGAASP